MTRVVTGCLVAALSSVGFAQSVRIGRPASPDSTGSVLVLRQYTASSGQGYGTMPSAYAIEAKRVLNGLAEVAVAGIAGADGPCLAPNGEALASSEVTHNILSVLGVRPLIGRDFTADDADSIRRVAILSHATWLRVFGGRQDAIGASVRLSGQNGPTAQIVGVLPVILDTPELDPDADILILSPELLRSGSGRVFAPLVRLAPGMAVAKALAALESAVAKLNGGPSAEPGTVLRLDTLR